ncbi:MAG: endonuclease/exonuclease/phosphatase family protein [Meiothermus sp.]|nr:endonuclease/exonuclease/phosphatase family protein [Meiothermus sp.]
MFWLSLLNLGLLLALWWSHLNLSEGRYWLATLAAYIPQHPYGIPAGLLLLGALWRRTPGAVALNLFALGFWLLALMGFALPKPAASGSPALRLMSYNVRLDNADKVGRIAQAIRAERPDALCMSEVFDWGAQQLSREFPGWYWRQAREVAIFSRHPLQNVVVRPMPGNPRQILEADLVIGDRRLKLVCVHQIAATLIDRRTRRPRFDTFLAEDRVRDDTTRLLLNVAAQSQHPVAVAGDFNTPPRVGVYRTMQAQMTDVWAARGFGLGFTYSSSRPLLRIDYIWTKGLGAGRVWVPRTGASDHFPLVADLVW